MNRRRLTPSMSLLLAFDASARHLSFTRASGELLLSQSVVSRQVQSLEQLLGVALFVREGRNITLSDVGKAYHDEVSVAVQRVRNASLEAMSSGTRDGEIHLFVFPTVASKWLMPRMHRFYAQHRRVLVHVHSRATKLDVAMGRIDAVIADADYQWPDMRAYHLLDECVLPVVAPSLQGELRRITDVCKMLLLRQHGPYPADYWHRWFLQQQLDPAQMKLGPSFDLVMNLIQAVSSGMGVGLLQTYMIQDELARGVLVPAFDAPMDTGYSLYLLVPASKVLWPPMAAFTEWILQEIRDEQCSVHSEN